MAPAPTSRSFPHTSLLVSYEECARFAQAYLQSFAHGDLKPWAASRQPPMNYRSLITFKNGKMAKPTPRIIQKILEENGFITQCISSYLSVDERATYFQFSSRDKLIEFKKKLQESVKIK